MTRLLLIVLTILAQPAWAEDSLFRRIDLAVQAASAGAAPAALCDDAGFLRRASLDLNGQIPTADDVRAFLADADPDKRVKLVDRLLASPLYVRRMTELFHVLLMERRGDNADWETFLRTSFETNRPWDEMVRRMLHPDPNDEATRGSGFFLTKRLENYGQNPIDYPGLTRDVSRLFLGQDLQCAQCHNHLFVDEYKQRDFQGLFVVFQNLSVRGDVKFPAVKEKPIDKKLEFVSVFDPTPMTTGPRIPGGSEFEPPTAQGTEVPSSLKLFADGLPTRENKLFVRNSVNRFWFLMMGRGLVHPLDLHHGQNPPSHPELLNLLADEFAAHQFDVKWLLRELVLSQTYQRAGATAVGQPPPAEDRFLVGLEKRLSAEQLLWSVLQATGQSAKTGKAEEIAALRKTFVDHFANQAREPEDEVAFSVKGTLFLMNGPLLGKLLTEGDQSLVEQVLRLGGPEAMVEELSLSILGRPSTAEEKTMLVEWLEKSGDRKKAVTNLACAMLTSMEFSVNH
jgi:hypothetical protein